MNHVVYATMMVDQDNELNLTKLDPIRRTSTFESDDVLYMRENEIDETPCTKIVFRTETYINVTETLPVMHKRVYGSPYPKS